MGGPYVSHPVKTVWQGDTLTPFYSRFDLKWYDLIWHHMTWMLSLTEVRGLLDSVTNITHLGRHCTALHSPVIPSMLIYFASCWIVTPIHRPPDLLVVMAYMTHVPCSGVGGTISSVYLHASHLVSQQSAFRYAACISIDPYVEKEMIRGMSAAPNDYYWFKSTVPITTSPHYVTSLPSSLSFSTHSVSTALSLFVQIHENDGDIESERPGILWVELEMQNESSVLGDVCEKCVGE